MYLEQKRKVTFFAKEEENIGTALDQIESLALDSGKQLE